ncbi:GGDEF domain-containing protein [bacterium]|nr:GGDEF domain-containing protein [bacterium]
MNLRTVEEKAVGALAGLSVLADEPMRIANVLAQRSVGLQPDVSRLLAHLNTRQLGASNSTIRYRWELSHRRCDPPAYAGPIENWKTWRPLEQPVFEQDAVVFEERLTIPILIADASELLDEIARQPTPGHVRLSLVSGKAEPAPPLLAAAMLAEAEPVLRKDLAFFVQMLNAWVDTFALFCLAQRPRAMARHRPIALAITASYASAAQPGYLEGTRFPFHGVPLVSATAHLAAGLLALGTEFGLLGRLVTWLSRAIQPCGGFRDGEEPTDVLTTLAAAQVLAGLDPSFNPAPTAAFLMSKQDRQGFFRALGPEVPWLTALVLIWLRQAEQQFWQRFHWPHPNDSNTDRKTGLAGFTYFLELCDLIAHCPCLATATMPFAFIDLVGFRAFNNQCGQDAGDQALEACAAALEELPGVKIVRDGGDEFLVIGAPGRNPLMGDLVQLRADWPAKFQARFGPDVPLVRMRALVGFVAGKRLRDARETLGRRIGELKNVKENHGAVIRDIGAIA